MRGGMGNMNNMMKQMQKMQKKMMKAQEELHELSFEATAGGGMVKVVANGKKEITDIEINEEVVDPDDVDMLQDLILAATNDVLGQVDQTTNDKMGQFTQGMNLPGF
ncbi:YbaB/EbfC family nucleoid-associated protein [Tenuibacillus multivorans]|uniref:Nucleoid-associated protein SAMN05216498_0578 n=1 Tax=Tenuibacillus multivorans TaxID=237069 RepID=A0A1G9W244_9BACI|nr:YbaB/EbfC family nucleoid-associated protein [Tenuibacillus multivorans]GEL78286.1 nucleoid-associated protein YaaK [Tenuibacillus multivorans]SDM78622.1 hypothetical protein SAMN05216498_0578 [Tenuibacillus multivorans]